MRPSPGVSRRFVDAAADSGGDHSLSINAAATSLAKFGSPYPSSLPLLDVAVECARDCARECVLDVNKDGALGRPWVDVNRDVNK